MNKSLCKIRCFRDAKGLARCPGWLFPALQLRQLFSWLSVPL